MSLVRINVSQDTFEKNLYLLGYTYKIKQFDDFILSFKKYINKELTSNIEKLPEKIEEIFGYDIPSSVLYNLESITHIKKDYLIKIINSRFLKYMEDKNVKYSPKVQKLAYMIGEFRKHGVNNPSYYASEYSFLKSNSIYFNKALKCLENNSYSLSEDEKYNERATIYKILIIDKVFTNYLLPVLFAYLTDRNYNQYNLERFFISLLKEGQTYLKNADTFRVKFKNINWLFDILKHKEVDELNEEQRDNFIFDIVRVFSSYKDKDPDYVKRIFKVNQIDYSPRIDTYMEIFDKLKNMDIEYIKKTKVVLACNHSGEEFIEGTLENFVEFVKENGGRGFVLEL